jgi:hypothetical protein
MMPESDAACDDQGDGHRERDADAALALGAGEAGQALLAEMIAGSLGPLSRISESIDLTLDQVSQWIAQPDNRRRIVNLVTLLDAQSQLLVCQYRVLAITRLVELAGQQSTAGPETVRRACADLLRLRLINPYQEDKRPPHARIPPPAAEPPIDEERILAALEELGRESDV